MPLLPFSNFFPYKNKLSTFSSKRGKIEIVTGPTNKYQTFCSGMLISFYTNKTNGKIYFADKTEIIMSPKYFTIDLMRWNHQILELCYYFLPAEKPYNDILSFIYNCHKIILFENIFPGQISTIKKIYLIKFLEFIGFFPEKELIVCSSLYNRLSYLYSNLADEIEINSLRQELGKITNEKLKMMNEWVLSYLRNHHCYKLFKTFKRRENLFINIYRH